MRTARATSPAAQSLETKPDAPAARAALGEIRPAPEISSTRVTGEAARRRSQTSAPDSSPRNRSTSATCGLVAARELFGLVAGARRRGSARPRAARRASAGSPSARRRGRRPPERAAGGRRSRRRLLQRHGQAHAPAALAGGARTRPGRRARAPRTPPAADPSRPSRARRRRDAVVDDLEHERAVGTSASEPRSGRVGVLGGVAHRLAQDGLRHAARAASGTSTSRAVR